MINFRITKDNGLVTVGAAERRSWVDVIDPDREFTIDTTLFKSRSRNSPFIGTRVKGKAVLTIVSGEVVFEDI